MALSIEEISRRAGIGETSGSFDYAEEDAFQDRILEDTQHLTAGGKGAAGPDPEIAKTQATNKQRAITAGLAPDPKAINASIYASEASGEDQRNLNQMTAYFEPSTNTYNIGPGLNLDSALVRKSLESRGINPEELKDIYDYQGKQQIDDVLLPAMREVFDEVVDGARNDARTYAGAGVWGKLKKHEKDALTDMSYNLGLGKLKQFVNLKTALTALVDQRSPEMVSVVLAQMLDSNWAKQVGRRSLKIMTDFSAGQDEASQRYLRGAYA